jgi:hypothetical protein
LRQARCNMVCCGKLSVFQWPLQNWCGASLNVAAWCSSLHDDVTHTASQRVARRCSTSCRSFLCRWAIPLRSHLLVGLAVLLFLPALVAAQTAITDANLSPAVIAWVTNPTTATTAYGPIADWNTAAVASMANLFYPTVAPATAGTARPTFNGDISKWNVASVSNMWRVRLDFVCAALVQLSAKHTCIDIYICVCARARVCVQKSIGTRLRRCSRVYASLHVGKVE